MARPAPDDIDGDWLPGTVRYPVELVPPEGFDPARVETWPRMNGRLEWGGGEAALHAPVRRAAGVGGDGRVMALGAWVRRPRHGQLRNI